MAEPPVQKLVDHAPRVVPGVRDLGVHVRVLAVLVVPHGVDFICGSDSGKLDNLNHVIDHKPLTSAVTNSVFKFVLIYFIFLIIIIFIVTVVDIINILIAVMIHLVDVEVSLLVDELTASDLSSQLTQLVPVLVRGVYFPL